MASLANDPGGKRRILFRDIDGKRQTIRLGKIPKQRANSIKQKVEDLVSARITGHAPTDETSRWLTNLDAKIADRLALLGLTSKRQSSTLAKFIDGYIENRGDVKSTTATVYGHTRRNLVEHFGADKPLRDITPGDADEWRLGLINGEELAENTVRRRSGIAKQFFTAAQRKGLVENNPFADLKAAVQANHKRFHFVSVEDSQKVLDACPDAEWRLLFALSRYGGLRCPSEHLKLELSDINWAENRLRVPSPKTEHHTGGESRLIPIFPELRPYLEEVFDAAEPGQQYLITRYRSKNSNLRTQLLRIIKKAGIDPWPKLFQNLRSTRETELAESFPLHVVCAWIGNTQAVAAKHYLQVTDDHFEKAAQKAAQHTPAQPRIAPHCAPPEIEKPGKHCYNSVSGLPQVGDEGLEPPTSSV